MRLENKVAIVTGAAPGPKAAIGSHYARGLASEGASVVLADVADCSGLAAQIEDEGGSALALTVDVKDDASVKAMVEATLAKYGRIDILVNNAALGANIPPAPMETMEIETWDEMMEVNVRGSFLCARSVAPAMEQNGYGKIINIGSPAIYDGMAQRMHYAASKGAVMSLTRSLARELGPKGIRVNTLVPGLVMNPVVAAGYERNPEAHTAYVNRRALRKDLYPADLVGPLLFLASEDSDAMTGQMLLVDQGAYFD